MSFWEHLRIWLDALFKTVGLIIVSIVVFLWVTDLAFDWITVTVTQK